MANKDATAESVAAWMADELKDKGELYQEEAVDRIVTLFGRRFTYDNQAGNPAIDKTVLAAFNKITGSGVVWERSRRLWRLRENGDDKGRMQP